MFPVVAPVGTGATILVAFQLVGVTAVPLNVSVLLPCVDPKLVPVIVTDVPVVPDVGLMLDTCGGGGAALNAANPAAHWVDAPSVALADAAPALVCIWSSAIS